MNSNSAGWPFPVALSVELGDSTVFTPVVEEYLQDSGWHRVRSMVSASWPVYAKGTTRKNLRYAMLEQLKLHRLDNSSVNPAPTPSHVRAVLHPDNVRRVATPVRG